MARDGLRSLVCAGAVLGVLTSFAAADDYRERYRTTLAVQAALQQGRAYLRAQDYAAAVKVLESQIARIEGNREYLIALRDAYRGHIKNLHLAHRDAEAREYASLLAILEKGPPLDSGRPAATPAAAKPAALPPAPVKVAPRTAPAEPLTARGKVEQPPPPPPPAKDPFAPENNKRLAEARGLLARAEQEFRLGHYRQAGELYARAHEAVPNVLGAAAGRWSYCRLNNVTDRLKHRDRAATAAELTALDQEVRAAMSLTPALKKFGDKCLHTIEQHRLALTQAQGVVQVKHTPRQPGGTWATVESASFRVFHNEKPEYAERVIRLAELTRSATQQKWFGKVEAPWSPRCDIFLHHTAEDYSRATSTQASQFPVSSPGHSLIHRVKGGSRIILRRIELHADQFDLLVGVLPHETTHQVLAGRFGPYDLPRWADEGMAILTESREHVERHLRNLPTHRRANQLFSMRQLLGIDDWPPADRIGPFYAESVSVVGYLCEQRGPQTFARFLADGLSGGYEAALRKHYGLRSFDDLDLRWQARTFSEGTPTQGVARRP